ncbi:MAG: prephenate dehydrogenase/arogenate dehydrogenase family protein [Pseudomonadales bacterium]
MHAAVAKGVIVTDVASVKGSVVVMLKVCLVVCQKNFIPGHPIAGSEKSGIDAVNENLFVRHRVILTPSENPMRRQWKPFPSLWRAVDAELSLMSVEEHDKVLALTSHLPHMLAYTLVDSAGTAFARIVKFFVMPQVVFVISRIAGSDPVMWHDIALANRAALLSG